MTEWTPADDALVADLVAEAVADAEEEDAAFRASWEKRYGSGYWAGRGWRISNTCGPSVPPEPRDVI